MSASELSRCEDVASIELGLATTLAWLSLAFGAGGDPGKSPTGGCAAPAARGFECRTGASDDGRRFLAGGTTRSSRPSRLGRAAALAAEEAAIHPLREGS